MIRRIAALTLLLLGAAFASADVPQAVLSIDGAVYHVESESAGELHLVKRVGTKRDTYVVPTTEDAEVESQVRLAWDRVNKTLFVLWHRSSDRVDQILLSRLYADGTWADPILIATGSATKRVGLEIAMTRATVDTTRSATLIHAAWWNMGAQSVAEYALIAFENGQHVSTSVTDLKTLAGISADAIELEAMADVVHPPLAIARTGANVEVVFGSPNSTIVNRVLVQPKLRVDARLWKPGRKGGITTPRANIQSANGQPVRAMLSQGRIVLYTPDDQFRFVIFDQGKWSPEHMIRLGNDLSSDQMVDELRKAVEQMDADAAPPATVIE
jgi:hypothetical protein